MKRKILIIIGSLDIGGTEKQLLKIIGSLSNYFDFTVLSFTRGGDLLKWIKSDYKTVIASDINNDNLMNIKNGIYKRYNNYLTSNPNSKQKMLFLQLDASKLWNKQYINTISDEKFQNLAKIFFGLQSKSAINDSVLLKFHKKYAFW